MYETGKSSIEIQSPMSLYEMLDYAIWDDRETEIHSVGLSSSKRYLDSNRGSRTLNTVLSLFGGRETPLSDRYMEYDQSGDLLDMAIDRGCTDSIPEMYAHNHTDISLPGIMCKNRDTSVCLYDRDIRYATIKINDEIIEKENNNMRTGKRLNYVLNNVISRGEEKLIGYGMNRVKSHFGKEFTWTAVDAIMFITNEFIKKYDKNFENHAQKSLDGTDTLRNTEFIVHLEKGTYMYVATGTSIANRELLRLYGNIDSLYIYIFGKKMHKYCREVNNICSNYISKNELGIYNIYAGQTYNERTGAKGVQKSLDIMYSKLQRRELSTLFFSYGEKEKICEHIDKFIENEPFYNERQILYKTGILLYGEPGTGKSSLVKAIASKYNRNIVNINIADLSRINIGLLTQAINADEQLQYIVLLEDIDTLFLNRKDESDKESRAVINTLLQFLDSNNSPNNIIFMATTNHIERLDDALLREGRFDLKVKVSPLTRSGVIEYGKSFGLSKNIMEEIMKSIDDKNGLKNHSHYYNQSMIQARVLSRIENKSIEKSIELHGEMIDSSVKKEENDKE